MRCCLYFMWHRHVGAALGWSLSDVEFLLSVHTMLMCASMDMLASLHWDVHPQLYFCSVLTTVCLTFWRHQLGCCAAASLAEASRWNGVPDFWHTFRHQTGLFLLEALCNPRFAGRPSIKGLRWVKLLHLYKFINIWSRFLAVQNKCKLAVKINTTARKGFTSM